MQIGFIGVGAMGGGLARNLIRAAGLLAKMSPGAVYIDVSTIDPGTARELEAAAKEKGIGFLECPLGKTPAQAETAEEPIFVGGDETVYQKVKDILEIIGNPVTYLGTVDAACAVKLISNLIGMTNLAVLAEGIRIGEAAGLDKKLLLELLDDTGAKSFQMNVRGPWIASGDFDARFGLDLALKDVRLGVEMAQAWGNDAKTMQVTLDYLKQASGGGLGKEDCNAIYKIIK
jgi:3-hydroxyisobutyrate dehydrogenase-like beta-hydroxyacid dehydrogenase